MSQLTNMLRILSGSTFYPAQIRHASYFFFLPRLNISPKVVSVTFNVQLRLAQLTLTLLNTTLKVYCSCTLVTRLLLHSLS